MKEDIKKKLAELKEKQSKISDAIDQHRKIIDGLAADFNAHNGAIEVCNQLLEINSEKDSENCEKKEKEQITKK